MFEIFCMMHFSKQLFIFRYLSKTFKEAEAEVKELPDFLKEPKFDDDAEKEEDSGFGWKKKEELPKKRKGTKDRKRKTDENGDESKFNFSKMTHLLTHF